MPHKIEFYSYEANDIIESEREYYEYAVAAAEQPDDQWDHARAVVLALHVDALTGIMVSDVEKYERSLR